MEGGGRGLRARGSKRRLFIGTAQTRGSMPSPRRVPPASMPRYGGEPRSVRAQYGATDGPVVRDGRPTSEGARHVAGRTSMRLGACAALGRHGLARTVRIGAARGRGQRRGARSRSGVGQLGLLLFD
jgi:hypothetical protein